MQLRYTPRYAPLATKLRFVAQLRGVPSRIDVALKTKTRHPFCSGVANSLVYIVGFRRKRDIK